MLKIFTTAHVAVLAVGLGFVCSPAIANPSNGRQIAVTEPAIAPTTVKAPARFDFYLRQGLPPAYRGKTNPNQVPTIPLVLKGADIYNARCASCHGLMGFGNGQASSSVRPRPADLAWSLSGPETKDDFLFWTIAEGGAQFGTSMPAFKKPDLTDEQIWQVITYMRAAFEGREARNAAPNGVQQAMRTVPEKAE